MNEKYKIKKLRELIIRSRYRGHNLIKIDEIEDILDDNVSFEMENKER